MPGFLVETWTSAPTSLKQLTPPRWSIISLSTGVPPAMPHSSLLRTISTCSRPVEKTTCPGMGSTKLQITLSEPAVLTPADVILRSTKGLSYGPVTLTGTGTNFTIMFAQPIDKAADLTLTVSIPGTELFMGRLNVLPGDVNGDGVVNSKDITIIRNQSRGKKGFLPTIYGDILGNGTVNGADLNEAKNTRARSYSRWAARR